MRSRNLIKKIPLLGPFAGSIYRVFSRRHSPSSEFADSGRYWEDRYARGGDSGAGSYGLLAEFKAQVLNDFVANGHVRSVLEFGCGDGSQLTLAQYPQYMGFDTSATAIDACRHRFSDDESKSFALMASYAGQSAQLSLSLDVIYHLVEDDVFEAYMNTLFDSASKFVIIYSSNGPAKHRTEPHVKHRKFTEWVRRKKHDWTLLQSIPNAHPVRGAEASGSFADFYIYGKRAP